MANIELIKKYVPDITDDEISLNVDIAVISAYGGMTCMIIPASEIVDFVNNQERELDLDYHLIINK